MENSKHCEICDHQSFNFKDGIICGLIERKAEFNNKCPDIKLDKNLKEKIIEINTEFQDSKYVKKLAIGNLIFYGIIGLIVLGFCNYLTTKLFGLGVFHTGSIVIFVIGIMILGIGIGAMNYSRQKREIIFPKKQTLDKLAGIYNIRYEFDSQISTDIMGIKETKITLRLNGEKIERINRY
ncbi:hypothetical protein [Flavobacterium sp. ASW18X]|uniref:hypothetical protein n=1 Tax=Flavobacterium sp. ASW18X TaxID=2572595 RepID=UPI0010AE3ED6|nr:hypothetical protein [Flavobacterium sp. ASW18X]TKD65905.1 hypothetical protein FBT53_03295 [Flavobacterium sp. ASW18X]